MIAPYFNRSVLLKEFGWQSVYSSWYPNCEYEIWEPREKGFLGSVADVYVFEGYSTSRGVSVRIIWAESLEQAKILVDNIDSGIPDFFPKNEEQFKALLNCCL